MTYLTTTELRTKSSQLVATLKKGSLVSLVHRSKIIGVISPISEEKIFDVEKFEQIRNKMNLKPTTYKERDTLYKKRFEEKYGKNIS